MSADSNPVSSAGSSSQISGITPEHRVANERKGKDEQRRRKKRPRSEKRVEVESKDLDVEQPLENSEDTAEQSGSIDYLA